MNKTFKKIRRDQVLDSVFVKELIPIEMVAQRLKDIRKALGMTQAQLAEKTGLKQAAVARLEKNVEASSFKTISKIAKALDCGILFSVYSETHLMEKIKRQAELKAKQDLDRAFSNMAFEKQTPDKKSYERQYESLVKHYVEEPGPGLWGK